MATDGIGGGKPLGGIGSLGKLSPTRTTEDLATEGLATEGLGGVAGASGASSAEGVDRARLENGEIDLDGYLELQVEHATQHLVDVLPPPELAEIQRTLRLQLESDPVLMHLVQRATAATR